MLTSSWRSVVTSIAQSDSVPKAAKIFTRNLMCLIQ